MRSGTGLLVKANKDTYEGHWAEDMYNGQGTLTLPSRGTVYCGTFVNGHYDGFGKLVCDDGSWYGPAASRDDVGRVSESGFGGVPVMCVSVSGVGVLLSLL